MSLLDQLGFAALLGITGATVAWFFPARRYMVSLEASVARELEEALQPIDSVYTLLGLYVGFQARYIVRGLREFRALLVLIPRHALLYLPIVLLRGERDILVLEAAPPEGVLSECLDAKPRIPRSARRQLRRSGVGRVARGCPGGLRKLLEHESVYAVYASRDAYGVVMEPRLGEVGIIASTLAEYARRS